MPTHEFKPATENIGIHPTGHRVLIFPDPVDDTFAGSKIVRPQTQRDREQVAQETGTIVEIGPSAWADQPEKWADTGDRVIFARYNGLNYKRGDKTYRLLNDLDIAGCLDLDEKETAASKAQGSYGDIE
jgi:co-chaperonin GroES (HSP10)